MMKHFKLRQNRGQGANCATATAEATVLDGVISDLKLTNEGSGYTAEPTVSFIGGGGGGASAVPTVENGRVTALKLRPPGHGYQAAPTVDISLDGGPALLSYGILSNPNPLQIPQTDTQVSSFTLNVSNSGTEVVAVAAIKVKLPGPSQQAQDLTNSFTGIGVQVPVDGNDKPLWEETRTGGEFTLMPLSDEASEIAALGIYFIFDNILVNQSVGACVIEIAETSCSSTQPNGIRAAPDIQLQKWPPEFSISGPTANPLQVNYGGWTEVEWWVKGSDVASELSFDPDGNGIQTSGVNNNSSMKVPNLTNPQGVTFTLQATLPVPGQSPLITQRQINVSVVPSPSILSFTIQPNRVTPGQPLTFVLAWDLADVTTFQITANDGPNGQPYTLPVPQLPKGSYRVTPLLPNVTYELEVLSPNVIKTKKEKL